MLARLPAKEAKTLRPYLSVVSLTTKDKIDEVGTPMRYVDFPIDAAISVLDFQPRGRTVEVAVIGPEGCTGSYSLSGLRCSPCRTIVQIGGTVFRVRISRLRPLLPRLPILTKIVRRFTAVLFRHAVISVGCSQFHPVEQRLARWLLAHQHRTGRKEFPFTHDFLAEQLGVQRVTVTQTLSGFQDKGWVDYRYGNVELGDIPAMRKAACGCFMQAKKAIESYLTETDH
ncbi:MAG TPA: Crp/Fnr family transcriptional regulator [Nitrospiraceae bacterium]|nr:Crp/Fnr family transcriptional regulator [Nitrospiraceae bacterium]